ncbi:type II toxin-antitoxin system VapC family toxin [Candidatus Pacearchaeota archaeon]|nr:type II toxin-antitoxin system VapC family toxin [Candidatus Pacearchaeota archaeon]
MSLVFDTSILISIERGEQQTINKLRELSKSYPSPPQLTFVSFFEYLTGLKIRKSKSFDDNLKFLKNFNVLHTTPSTAEILSDLKVEYDKKGMTLPLADLLSASIVIENNFILVTKDKDFDKIGELKKIIL